MIRRLVPVVFALGCTEIPEPSATVPSFDAGDASSSDATLAEGGAYTGPCDSFEGIKALGFPGFYLAGDAPGTAVNYILNPALDVPSGEYFRLGVYAAGDPDEIRGRVQALGNGANASLASCVHCVVIERECESNGVNCKRGPYFPRSGRTVVAQMNAQASAPFMFELSGAELVRVEIDETTLETTRVSSDDDCIYMERLWLGAEMFESGLPCHLGKHCDLAKTASLRHPD